MPPSGFCDDKKSDSRHWSLLSDVHAGVINRREHLLQTSKTPQLRYGHRHVVLSNFSNEHRDVPPVNQQQKCLIKEICGTSDMKSNYFGPWT